MGGTQNVLSQFGELKWIKCGEIKMCSNRNDFQLSCVHCNSVFTQMAVFARHLHWEHQLGDELQGNQKARNGLSIYTVEELLTNKNIDTKLDDTGLGSDEELEKEIQELLTSMASTDSFSSNETEYSENDSGFGLTKNIHGNSKNTQDHDIPGHNIILQTNFERKSPKEADTAKTQTLPKEITIARKDGNGFGKSKALKGDVKYKSLDLPKIQRLQTFSNTTKNVGISIKCTKTNTKEVTSNKIKNNKFTKEELNCSYQNKKKSENASKNKKKLPLKKYLESKNFLLQSDDESKSNDEWNKRNTGNQRKEVFTNVLVLKKETTKAPANQNKLDNILNVEDIECVPPSLEDQASTNSSSEKKTNTLDSKDIYIDKGCNNILTKTEDLLSSDISNVEKSKGDNVNNSSFIDKEINCIKNNGLGIQISDGNFVEIQYDAPTIYDLDGYQREYVSYNDTNEKSSSVEETISQQSKCTTHEMEIEKPLDLSFNKSNEWTDMQLDDLSELLPTNGKVTTELIEEDFDELLVQQQPNFTGNPSPLFNSDQLQISDMIVGNLLPPFSKFFKNNVNTLKNSNNFMAQPTPKEKKMKNSETKDLVMKTLKSNENISTEIAQNNVENAENVIPKHKINEFCRNLQRRFNSLKRVSQYEEKENQSKKRKQEVGFAEEIMKENETAKKLEIEILSVDIILPNENKSQSELATFSSTVPVVLTAGSNAKDCEDLQISSVKQEVNENENWGASTSDSIIEDLIPYVKIKKPTVLATDLSSHAAADSTSEQQQQQPAPYISEIDYTPDDTLNQLRLNADDEKLFFNSTMESCFNVSLPCDSQNNTVDDSMLSNVSEEEQENYTLLRSVGLKIVMDPKTEDELTLDQMEEMRAKASTFAKIYAEFKYLWKVGKGIKSYEQLELDFNRLMQRLKEYYKFELTISQTKRIVNLVSLWYMQTYHNWFIEKKRVLYPIQFYLHTFAYLPKTARRVFYCEECPRYFLSQQKYFAHRQVHNVLVPTCANCQTSFASRKEQRIHTKMCATFKCMECAFKLENAANLEYHVRSTHMFQCEKCGKLCATAADLDWHEHQYPIICGLCNRLFDTAAELQMHRQDSFHWDYTCRTCEIFLPTATQMKQHLRLCMSNTM